MWSRVPATLHQVPPFLCCFHQSFFLCLSIHPSHSASPLLPSDSCQSVLWIHESGFLKNLLLDLVSQYFIENPHTCHWERHRSVSFFSHTILLELKLHNVCKISQAAPPPPTFLFMFCTGWRQFRMGTCMREQLLLLEIWKNTLKNLPSSGTCASLFRCSCRIQGEIGLSFRFL